LYSPTFPELFPAHIMSEHVPKVIIVEEVYVCLASSVHSVYTLYLMCNHVR